jgi:hypothetical protein
VATQEWIRLKTRIFETKQKSLKCTGRSRRKEPEGGVHKRRPGLKETENTRCCKHTTLEDEKKGRPNIMWEKPGKEEVLFII